MSEGRKRINMNVKTDIRIMTIIYIVTMALLLLAAGVFLYVGCVILQEMDTEMTFIHTVLPLTILVVSMIIISIAFVALKIHFKIQYLKN